MQQTLKGCGNIRCNILNGILIRATERNSFSSSKCQTGFLRYHLNITLLPLSRHSFLNIYVTPILCHLSLCPRNKLTKNRSLTALKMNTHKKVIQKSLESAFFHYNYTNEGMFFSNKKVDFIKICLEHFSLKYIFSMYRDFF